MAGEIPDLVEVGKLEVCESLSSIQLIRYNRVKTKREYRRLSRSFTYTDYMWANPLRRSEQGGLKQIVTFGYFWTGGWGYHCWGLLWPYGAAFVEETLQDLTLVLSEQIPVYAIMVITMGLNACILTRLFFQPQGLHLSTRLRRLFRPIERRIVRYSASFIDPIDTGFIIRTMR